VQEQKGRFSHAQVGKAFKLKKEPLNFENLIGKGGLPPLKLERLSS
jgi:hypothetical protein